MEARRNPGYASGAMILTLRILYFEDLSVGMTEFARAHKAAGSSKSLGSY
jgi:hypothetical protein